MQTHAEYDSAYPLPYFGVLSLVQQIDAYINQQEWLPEPGKKRRPRQSRDDLRRTKCIIRYKAQMLDPINQKHLARALKISTQAVRLKMIEYIDLGYVKYDKKTNTYQWATNDEEQTTTV